MRFLCFAVFALLFSSPARAEWWRAQTDQFVVYSESRPKDTKEFAERLERFAQAMRIMQKMPPSSDKNMHRLTIYRFGDISDIADLHGSNRSVAGFYIPRATGSVAFVPARGEQSDRDGVLFHEYAHSFMLQHFPAAYPAWYVEGFAELYSTARFLDDGVFRIGEPAYHRADQLIYDEPYPAKKLFEPKPKPQDARHYYSVGWLLTHYLTFAPKRSGQLAKYLSAINRGVTSEQAAREAFGDLDELSSEVKRYQGTRLMGIEYTPAAYVVPRVELRRLTAAEAAMMPVRLRSERGVNKKTAPRLASNARDRAKPFPNDPFVQTALAEAEFDADNLDAAEAAAKRALAANPAAVDAMTYLGLIEMKRGKTDTSRYAVAREWFVKANRQQPDHPGPLINNYLALDQAGKPIPETAIIGLERAFELAPFDDGLRLLLARQLLREGRAKPARDVLVPVAFSSHGGKPQEEAEKAIARIDANDVKSALAIVDKQLETEEDEDGEDKKRDQR